jgi:hypothetical protein
LQSLQVSKPQSLKASKPSGENSSLCRGGNRCRGMENASRQGFAVKRFFARGIVRAMSWHAVPVLFRASCLFHNSLHTHRTLIAPGKTPVCP